MPTPRLLTTREPRRPEGVVLVLHGGASRQGALAVSPTQLSVLRMVPVAHRVARAGRGRLAVLRLLNTSRGWDTEHTPVDDVRWALDQVGERDRLRGLPVGLVGHSLGGRAALLAGAEPNVRSIVALNPWVYADDTADLTGRRVLIAHGAEDRVASPARAEGVARRLARTADSVGFLRVRDGKHAMLSRGSVFERAAADFMTATLLGTGVQGPVEDLLGGTESVTV